MFCECMQHLTARGCADVNDVVWNVMGMGIEIGVFIGVKMMDLFRRN